MRSHTFVLKLSKKLLSFFFPFKFPEYQNTDTVGGAIWNMPKMILNFVESHKGNQESLITNHSNTSAIPIKQETEKGNQGFDKAEVALAGLI